MARAPGPGTPACRPRPESVVASWLSCQAKWPSSDLRPRSINLAIACARKRRFNISPNSSTSAFSDPRSKSTQPQHINKPSVMKRASQSLNQRRRVLVAAFGVSALATPMVHAQTAEEFKQLKTQSEQMKQTIDAQNARITELEK